MSLAIEDLKNFLDHSPTSWHAVKEMGNRLALHDFIPLKESEPWHLEKGKKYFVSRNGAFLSFCLPSQEIDKSLIMASHTDSPGFKLKPNPETIKEGLSLLSAEVYGGPLITSWLNRDLAIAGKVMVSTKDGNIEEKLIFADDCILCIPQLAIHMDRESNDKGPVLNKQDHLKAILGLTTEKCLESLLRRYLSFQTLLSYDLFLVPVEHSRYLGINNEFISSYRIDNLVSSHASIVALGNNPHPSKYTLQICISWDHEEIGSKSTEGAYSTFLEDVLSRIYSFYNLSEEQKGIIKSKSTCLSIDMAHAYNPNYENKYEPNHKPHLGKGITIKFNADHKYATNSSSAAFVVKACNDLNMNHQKFVVRSDMNCGSTVGPITAHKMGISTVDIGVPQLSMHSCRELICIKDYEDLCIFLSYLIKNEIS
ncbi:MAG: M18 family aminopeptidase [Chlamydiae bacterium]|nr:M18 family aminopeptidase [Chlamydiota bacterium]